MKAFEEDIYEKDMKDYVFSEFMKNHPQRIEAALGYWADKTSYPAAQLERLKVLMRPSFRGDRDAYHNVTSGTLLILMTRLNEASQMLDYGDAHVWWKLSLHIERIKINGVLAETSEDL